MGNDPVNLTDPSGGISINFGTLGSFTGSVLADRALITLGGAALGYGIDRLTGGNGWPGAAIGGGVALGATFIPPFDISAVTNWTRDWLPGIIAAPVSGTLNALASGVGAIGGIAKGDKAATNSHLNNAGKGLLQIVGLKEAITEQWKPGATGGRLPNSLSDIMDDINTQVWSGYVDAPDKNGMHAWHAGTNAALAQRLGPIGSLFVFLGGIYHETPFDKGSFSAEQAAQGTINHILDSFSDIISNGIGIGVGMILPKKIARNVAIKVGNQIPGPGDPDPHGRGTGGYTGNPLDAWGQYPKFK